MAVSSPWLLFTHLAVFGMVVYSACFKLAGKNIEAFTFTLILGATQSMLLLVGVLAAKYGFGTDLIGEIRPREVGLAILAGLAVIVIDVSLFLAFRHGTAIMTNTYSSIAQILLFAVLSIYLFHETLTLAKGAGIALGVVSLVLLAL
ncbi:MAG: hypothetical protein AB7H77_00190 [Bdellovibrionales bacterium]